MGPVTGKSGRGTARQTVRIDHERWERFETVANQADTDRSKLINDFVAWYTREPGAKLPKRPERTEP